MLRGKGGHHITMELTVIDTEAIYRRLLGTPDAARREAIYREELLAPFGGLFRVFGGGDPLAMAGNWTLYTPEQFADSARPTIAALVDRLAAADAWRATAEALERGRAAFVPYAERVALETVTCALVIADKRRAHPLDRGYTGFGGIPGYVLVVYSDANDYTLPRIGGASVHELNHNMRFSAFPFNPRTVTVGEYIVAEGLAEAFAAELFGAEVVGFYVADFKEEDQQAARRTIGAALDTTGFDAVRGYIFGDTLAAHQGLPAAGVPDYAGYALGYRTVRRYLERTGKTAAEATFVPSAEIIAASGFFDEGLL
jgi:uncharacterized protein YjaZ